MLIQTNVWRKLTKTDEHSFRIRLLSTVLHKHTFTGTVVMSSFSLTRAGTAQRALDTINSEKYVLK